MALIIPSRRWIHQSLCNRGPEGNMFFNATACMDLADRLPECLDSIQYSYQQRTLTSRTDAMQKCVYMVGHLWDQFPEHDPYDHRTKVSTVTQAPSWYSCNESSALPKDVGWESVQSTMFSTPLSSKILSVDLSAGKGLHSNIH